MSSQTQTVFSGFDLNKQGVTSLYGRKKTCIHFAGCQSYNRCSMNNDKRMILAIAVYAAVITMILHTLSADAHEQFLATENKYAVEEMVESNPVVQTVVHVSMCSGGEDLQTSGGFLINEYLSTTAHSSECMESKISNCAPVWREDL